MVQMELLWAATALMLLGAAISFCVKCQRSAIKREKQLNEQRSQLRSRQSFEVIRSHSTMTRRLEQIKEPENLSIVSKTTKELGASCHAGYEDCLQGDDTYVEPISLGYYNSATLFTPPNGPCVIAIRLEASMGPGVMFIKGCSGAVVLEGCPSLDQSIPWLYQDSPNVFLALTAQNTALTLFRHQIIHHCKSIQGSEAVSLFLAQSGFCEQSLHPHMVLARCMGMGTSSFPKLFAQGNSFRHFVCLVYEASEWRWDETHCSMQAHLRKANTASVQCSHLPGYPALLCTDSDTDLFLSKMNFEAGILCFMERGGGAQKINKK
ncbi:linker for activation of T-cells family member 2 isoform 2-T2 [Amazona ochrocephala]